MLYVEYTLVVIKVTLPQPIIRNTTTLCDDAVKCLSGFRLFCNLFLYKAWIVSVYLYVCMYLSVSCKHQTLHKL